jgi:TRAP transporter TAXI family solute receptor
MKKMAKALAVTLIVGMAFIGFNPAYSQAAPASPEAIAIGTAGVGGVFYVLSVSVADMVSKHTRMSATAQPVGGSDANVRAIKMGKVHVAMVNTFSSINGYRGTKQFAKDGKQPILLMALGQPSLRQMVARVDSGVKTIPDLKGKKLVAKRKALAEIELVSDAMLKVYGMSSKDVKYIATARTDATIDALISKTVDAAVMPAGVPAGFMMKLFERADMRYMDIPENKMKEILDELGPAFHLERIPKGTYKGHDKDAYAPALSASLVAADNLSGEAVYDIMKAVYGHFDDFKLSHKAARYWTIENSLAKFAIPFHPGAIKYFKEIKAWKPEHEKKQQALMSGK